ncbi:MAG: hypothetical protein KDB27_32235, partial [Planctomycetales bacterium]|nr:hypothetical protein [Planctomycetales bacterium]
KSLELLTELADQLPDQVTIYLRGCPSLLGESALQQVIEKRRNMIFDGEYVAPDDFPEIYSRVHFNWCGDFSDGDNSLWLLPNRIYEGGYFGIPAIAIEGYETGRVVKQRSLGATIDVPYVDSLKTFLLNLNPEQYRAMRKGIETQPRENFVGIEDLDCLLTSLSNKP